MGLHHVPGRRLSSALEGRVVLHHDDLLLGLDGQERLHRRHHRNIQRNQSSISGRKFERESNIND